MAKGLPDVFSVMTSGDIYGDVVVEASFWVGKYIIQGVV